MKKLFETIFIITMSIAVLLILIRVAGADVYPLIIMAEDSEESTKPKIKAMFWDESRQHATDKVQVDLDNGQTITLVAGEEMPQYYIYRFKINSELNEDEIKALEKRVKVLEKNQIEWKSGVSSPWTNEKIYIGMSPNFLQ